MTSFRAESDRALQMLGDGSICLPIQPMREGYEVEQSAALDNQGHACTPRLVCPNPTNLPVNIPPIVMFRSVILGSGHWDGSRPWEFNLGHSIKEYNLVRVFKQIVKKDFWTWHTEFRNEGDLRGCSAHYHISISGDINLGPMYDNQMVAPAEHWCIAWNNSVTLTPITIAFYCYGRRFRESASKWAKPVLDRFDPKNICEMMDTGKTVGAVSHYNFIAGHDYTCLSWNRHSEKKQITMENRLNETHPFFAAPFINAFSSVNAACIHRGSSIKMKNSFDTLKKYWSFVGGNDVYKAMLKMVNVEFVCRESGNRKTRGVPFLCDDEGNDGNINGGTTIYPTALDFFRKFTRRFIQNKIDSGLNYGKVMRIWSDFIDFSKLPSYLLWDVDELYRLLYEDEQKRYYQDEYLYFGSSVVSGDDQSPERWVSSVI